MPKIEVDEDEHNRMVALRGVASKIVSNPAARKLLEQAQKLVDPNAATPTLDADAAITTPLTDLEKRLTEKVDSISKTLEDRDRQTRVEAIAVKQASDKVTLRRDGYTDEGLTAIDKIMSEKGLLDVMDAVAIFERSNPPPIPVTPGSGSSWNFTDVNADADKNISDLISTKGANDQIVDRMAREALNEFRGQIAHR